MKKGMKNHNCRKCITSVNQGINAVIVVATVHMTSKQQEHGMKEYMRTYGIETVRMTHCLRANIGHNRLCLLCAQLTSL